MKPNRILYLAPALALVIVLQGGCATLLNKAASKAEGIVQRDVPDIIAREVPPMIRAALTETNELDRAVAQAIDRKIDRWWPRLTALLAALAGGGWGARELYHGVVKARNGKAVQT